MCHFWTSLKQAHNVVEKNLDICAELKQTGCEIGIKK